MGKRKCAVKDCPSEEIRPEDIGVTFHKLPTNINHRLRWMELCKIEEDQKLLFVCSRHFLKADFGNFKAKFMLKPKVVPSIFAWQKRPGAPTEVRGACAELTAVKEGSHVADALQQSKRIRKKKLNPDYVMSFKRSDRAGVAAPSGSKSADEAACAQSEDTASADMMPPVLEPAAVLAPQGDVDKIPELIPSVMSLDPSTDDTFLKSKKRARKPKPSCGEEYSSKKRPKLASKEKEKLTVTNSLPSPGASTSCSQSIIKDKIMVEDKCTASEILKAEATPCKLKDTEPTVKMVDSEVPAASPSSAVEQQSAQQYDTMDGRLTFEPNTRIEALDINQTWSPATIVEVDYEENEVLVHFDTHSNKYDEWIGIHSSSIRAPTSSAMPAMTELTDCAEVSYQVGERCMAYWADTKKFPATVREVVDHETYVVQFDDGYVQQLHVSKMSESSTLFMPAKGSKAERRRKKRKLNVQSLFNKRLKKSVAPAVDTAIATDDGSSADETPMKADGSGYFDRDSVWYPNFDESGAPVGTPSQLRSKAGARSSTIVPDPNLPAKWEKHVVQREGGKFYSVIVTPDGKKLRCSADVQRYIMDHPTFNFQDYRLDFNIIPRNQRALFPNTLRHRDRVASKDRKSLDVPERERDSSPPPPPPTKSDSLKILQVDGGYQCPIDGCGKCFRRENLVQMHVKHYHPEFTKFLESTPNVLDLVYQRLRGDAFEHSSPGRSYDSYRRSAAAPPTEELVAEAQDFDCQRDVELKKLLGSAKPSGVESGGGGGSFESAGSTDSKARDALSSDSGPDLKSLVVTTKSGLKTIPPLKKSGVGELGDGDDKRRKADEFEDYSDNDAVGELDRQQQQQQPSPPLSLSPPPPQAAILDHIIGEDGKVIKIEHMRKEEIIHCTCGVTEEDGLMIQCEICMCWQHAHCSNIYRETEVPEKYVCSTCLNPHRQRSSMKYKHDQDWLKHGRLPTGGFHCRDDEANRKRFEDLRRSHDISGGLLELQDYMHTLKRKIKIAEVKNHPKLYLWSKPWKKNCLPERAACREEDVAEEERKHDADGGDEKADAEEEQVQCDQSGAPQPEAAIETADCRINLLEHILHSQSLIGARLADFEQQMDELEVCGGGSSEEQDNRMRLTTSMLLRDLGKLREFARLI